MVDLEFLEIPVEPMDGSELPFLAKYFPNIFAEALVPLNPRRWPAFVAGSAMASEMPDLSDKLETPFNNLVVAKEYLETAQSDLQYRDRFWKLLEDTLFDSSF